MNILHVMSAVDTGGIAMVVLNYYENLIDSNIKFDIAITEDTVGQIGKEFEKMGVQIYKNIPQKSLDICGYRSQLIKILEYKEYDAIHVHENQTSYVALA